MKNENYEKLAEAILKDLQEKIAKQNLINAECDKEIVEAQNIIQEKYITRKIKISDDIKKLEKSLQALLRQFQGEFVIEGRKERSCQYGSYGWRWGGDAVKIEDKSALMEFILTDQTARQDCGTFEFKPNKEGIKRRLQIGELVSGCLLGGTNRSFYELTKIQKEENN